MELGSVELCRVATTQRFRLLRARLFLFIYKFPLNSALLHFEECKIYS